MDLAYLRAHPQHLPTFLTHQRIRETPVSGGSICVAQRLTFDDGASIFAKSLTDAPGGFFAFSILHPCFPGWESRGANPSWRPGQGYFAEGWWVAAGPAGGIRPRVGANHRMLSTYLNTLARHGLIVEEMAEPEPPADWMAAAPAAGPVPVYLVVRCRKR